MRINLFTILLVFITVLLNGCAATAVVNTKAEGYYVNITPLETPRVYNINNENLLLCFFGKHKSDGEVSSKAEGDYVVLLPNQPPFSGTHSSTVINNSCAKYINSLQTTHNSILVYTVKKDKNCAYNDDCAAVQWEVYKDNTLFKNGVTEKEDKRNSKEYFNSTIIKNIINPNKVKAIYAVEDKYREQKTVEVPGKNSVYKYYYEYSIRGYDLYYANTNEILNIDLKSIYMDGNAAWYALIPFAILADIITFPIQLIMGINAVNEIGN